MKRFLTVFLCALCTIFSAIPVFAKNMGTVTDDRVNLRALPSTSSEVLDLLNKGYNTEVLSLENDFYKISYDGKPAYIHKNYLTITSVDGVSNSNGVNVRMAPSTDAQSLGKLSHGQAIKVKARSADWYQVEYNGYISYVHSDFLNVAFPDAIKTISPTAAHAAASYQPAPTPAPVTVQPTPEPIPSPESSQVSTELEPSVQGPVIDEFPRDELPTVDDYTLHEEIPDGDIVEEINHDALYAVVTAYDGLNFRYEPSTDSPAFYALPYDSVADVLEIGDEWCKVSYGGQEGYVFSEYITIGRGEKPSRIIENNKAQEIIAYAKRFLGTPYVWGGSNLTKGVDCSGFVYSVFKNFGMTLNRSSRTMVSNGYKVQKNELIPGDLVFFDTDGSNNGAISHVGIYIGDGNFIHSSSSKRTWGVVITNLSDPYYIRTYVTAVRVLK